MILLSLLGFLGGCGASCLGLGFSFPQTARCDDRASSSANEAPVLTAAASMRVTARPSAWSSFICGLCKMR
ncbi:hypothetical protein PR002_g11820 [Phytophthora rubi]|uniref:RxLR effector protein n=1 Tax=Phytophthora rubi TaxID=129364 RepID=A0A6A3LUY1_9STRA|nr:hypothetical protein PR002_g11820 [Phytophthora rubi]